MSGDVRSCLRTDSGKRLTQFLSSVRGSGLPPSSVHRGQMDGIPESGLGLCPPPSLPTALNPSSQQAGLAVLGSGGLGPCPQRTEVVSESAGRSRPARPGSALPDGRAGPCPSPTGVTTPQGPGARADRSCRGNPTQLLGTCDTPSQWLGDPGPGGRKSTPGAAG